MTLSSVKSSTPLDVRNLCISYGPFTAVNSISFSVEEGQVVALLGPNGAGKTSTVEACEGFSSASSGDIRVFGHDPYKMRETVRPLMGIMTQSGGCYPSARPLELINLVSRYYQDPLDPHWLMDNLGLNTCAKTPYRQLSGGQKQRLSLACAIVSRPRLLFLDEPTAGLDAQSRRAVWDIISAAKSDGTAIMLTTHLMDEASQLADDIIILKTGEIVAQGTAAQLQQLQTGHNHTLTLSGEWDVQQVQALCSMEISQLGDDSASASSFLLPRSLSGTEFVAVASAVDAAGSTVLSYSPQGQSLEEVFLQLTGTELS